MTRLIIIENPNRPKGTVRKELDLLIVKGLEDLNRLRSTDRDLRREGAEHGLDLRIAGGVGRDHRCATTVAQDLPGDHALHDRDPGVTNPAPRVLYATGSPLIPDRQSLTKLNY